MLKDEQFINALVEAFEEHGKAAIDRLATEQPLEFLKLCAAVIQEEIRINFNAGDAGEVCH